MKRRRILATVAMLAAGTGLVACSSDEGGSDASNCTNTITKTERARRHAVGLVPQHAARRRQLQQAAQRRPGLLDQRRRRAATSTTSSRPRSRPGTGRTRRRSWSRPTGIPTFQIQDALVDLKRATATTTSRRTSATAPGRTSRSATAVYGVPVDGGPMAMIYRKDIFDKYGSRRRRPGPSTRPPPRRSRTPAARSSVTSARTCRRVTMALLIQKGAAAVHLRPGATEGEIGIKLERPGVQGRAGLLGRPRQEGPGRHAGPVHPGVHRRRHQRQLRDVPLGRLGARLPHGAGVGEGADTGKFAVGAAAAVGPGQPGRRSTGAARPSR